MGCSHFRLARPFPKKKLDPRYRTGRFTLCGNLTGNNRYSGLVGLVGFVGLSGVLVTRNYFSSRGQLQWQVPRGSGGSG